MKNIFHRIASKVSDFAGSPVMFIIAVLIIATWAVSGSYFDYSDTWQLVINTGTTIVTFLMVFLIQNTQNRDSKAMQLKLDELIRSNKLARDDFVSLESLTDEELHALDEEFKKLHDSQATSALMKKLHASLSAEHTRRKGHLISTPVRQVATATGHVAERVRDTLSGGHGA